MMSAREVLRSLSDGIQNSAVAVWKEMQSRAAASQSVYSSTRLSLTPTHGRANTQFWGMNRRPYCSYVTVVKLPMLEKSLLVQQLVCKAL